MFPRRASALRGFLFVNPTVLFAGLLETKRIMQLTEEQIRRIARQEGKKIVNGGGLVIGGGSGAGTAETAREAQHAKEADHAASADKAAEADHATKAAGLDDDAQTALDNKYLRKGQDDETTHKLTMGEAAVKGDLTLGPNVYQKEI
jgi:hypothetical protein